MAEPSPAGQPSLPSYFPDYIYGIHERGGEQMMLQAKRPGWVLELAAIGLDGTNTPADFNNLAEAGLGVVVRINHGYGSTGTIPTPDRYADFAAACARYVARSRGCHTWIIGNEPNHADERPNGQLILPYDYARVYTLCRQAIRGVAGHEEDLVLVAGSAPWNATTTYPGNEKGDWIRYFVDSLLLLPEGGCDGFALHTYTHRLDPKLITGDYFHTTPGYRHLRNEFRTYRDYMNAIPDRFRRLPVLITETDPTTRGVGWEPGNNTGWVQAAYGEIAGWNSNPAHQPIQGLLLYRWPRLPDQPEWSLNDRPGILADFKQALAAGPASAYQTRAAVPTDPPTVLEPGTVLPADKQWQGIIMAEAGLNLRTGPSTQHTVLDILPHETAVTVLGEVDEWLYVRVLGKVGYVSRAFVLRSEADAIVTEPEREFLRNREELYDAPLAPPKDEQIYIDPARKSWTEQAVANAWNRFGALIQPLGATLEIDPAIAVAVVAIESGGRAFAEDGRMLIRFENHIFFEEWGKLDPERFAQFFRFKLDEPWQEHQWRPAPDQAWRDFHGDPAAEWEVFTFARNNLNAPAAFRSISMGLPQIMGFNHEKVGYGSAQAMFEAFSESVHAQVLGFFDFVNAEPARLEALRGGDFMGFAAGYNGSGQAPLYAALIQDGVKAYQRLRSEGDVEAAATAPGNVKGDDNADSGEEGQARLPVPPAAENLADIDPELYEAWRKHVLAGFTHNEEMFQRLVAAFMGPYHTTVMLYRLTFLVGLVAFITAVGLSIYTGELWFSLVFGGVSVASFLTFFLTRPLRALEENLNFITWLGVIYNSYWTRLVYAMNMATVQDDIAAITDDFVRHMQELVDKNAEVGNNRPGLR